MNILTISLSFSYKNSGMDILNSFMVDLFRINKIFSKISDENIVYSDTNGTPFEFHNLKLGPTNDFDIMYKETVKIVKQKDDLLSDLLNIEYNNYNKIVFYYSGHGDKGIEMPSGEILYFDELIDIFKSSDREIIMILDCCKIQCTLPYSFRSNKFMMDYDENCSFDIISFCSSSLNERIDASVNGSIFTKTFVEFIIDCRKRINKLFDEMLKINQSIVVQSSLPRRSTIPNWIYPKDNFVNINDGVITFF